ncbi:DUF2716 domain-containing protein [Longispora albida]|uniref:DUF2716 domain-containing protein n=1 Tax=Longispora albida TaxID=203523 RepID=UPI00036A593E|nr:DUF2716 domain-containing protein [Longispora albida]
MSAAELDLPRRDLIWAAFATRYAFRPSVVRFPGISEPAASVTWDLTALESRPELDRAGRITMIRSVPEGQGLYVLDWQHPCFWLDPARTPPRDWPLGVYPDGDYYIHITQDLSAGLFGHPWEKTLCAFGDAVLPHVAGLDKLMPRVRYGGQPLDA